MAAPRWTDSHCHLQEPLQDSATVDAALGRAGEAGVDRIVVIGTGLETSTAAIELAQRVAGPAKGAAARAGAGAGWPLAWATVGLHPHDASDGLDPVAALLATAMTGAAGGQVTAGGATPGAPRPAGSVVGVGECGLDYYYEHSPRNVQRAVFAEQIALATSHDLALVVHTRDAWDDTLELLAAEGPPERTVIHCFTGGPDEARRCLDLGAFLSFSGIVTFKNAGELREAAQLCPSDRLLVETDSPFLAPVPFRGRPNEPAYVALVGELVASLRGVAAEELAETTAANATRLFRLGA